MRKMLLALLLLLPGQALAGPAEGVSGRMVFDDEVAAGLRKYREERDEEKRAALLHDLARTRDPRVALVLGELFQGRDAAVAKNEVTFGHIVSKHTLQQFYATEAAGREEIYDWWKANEADLRRRASRLPR